VTKHIQFAIEDIDMMEEINEDLTSQFSTARIQAFSSDANRHDLVCTEDTLKKTASSIYDKPVLYTIDDTLDDFYTHVTPEKSLICGFVVPNSAEFIRLPDSRLALSVTAKIWKRYAPKVVELFKRDRGNKKVSVEMELYETSPIDDVLTRMESFAYTGICILGTYVTEASPGANIQVLSFSDETNEYKKLVKQEFQQDKYGELNFAIPETVKATVKNALRENKRKGGGNSVTLSIAKILDTNNAITAEEIRHIESRITHRVDTAHNNLNFKLCGGTEAIEWSTNLVSRMNEIDKKDFSSKEDEKNKEKLEMNMTDKVEDKEVEDMTVDTPKIEEKETPAEEKKETPAEEKKEEAKGVEKKFEFPANFDMEVMGKFFAEDEDETAKMAVEELKKEFADPAVVMSAMFAKMCKMAQVVTEMSETSKAYMAENEDLKKFKADFETSQKQFEVEKTLKEMSEKVVLSDEARAEMSADAENFSLDNIEQWKTSCKAKSFDFAIREKGKSDDVVRVGMPFGSGSLKAKDDLWAK